MHRSKGPKSLLAILAAIIGLMLVAIAPAGAITKGGVVDTDNEYPYVGLMVAYVKDGKTLVPSWRCTGTLVSPKLFVTAGHCTYGADHVEIWFDYDVTDAEAQNYPGGPGDASGTPYTHPEYDDNAFYLHDLGVVVLKKAYTTADGTYAQLLGEDDLGLLDGLAVGTTFTTVGYGLQASYPEGTPPDEFLTKAERLRMIATPKLRQYGGNYALLLSNNSNTGGTCFGDSGGPSFYDGLLVAVTSFGYTDTCASHGGVYRLDTADDLNWLYGTFGRYL
jgi:secreted trypsin-like serine protease